ncbi:MAG: hypothetical protein H8D63_02200 [Parcubacteria group bacterium]|nr:hypothetical protein [Parcubacteria group bacterium]
MASTRIRAYDVIRFFSGDMDIRVGLYIPFRRYDVVVFQKVFDARAYKRAIALRRQGVRIVLDINVNYYDTESKKILPSQRDAIMRFTCICDAVIVSSHYIAGVVKELFPDTEVVVIEESLHGKYFLKRKDVSHKPKTLIWVGYYPKAGDITQIRDVLIDIFEANPFQIIIVSNREHKIDLGPIPVSFVPYCERDIVAHILHGDIFIAPRDVHETYNQGHTFTKIGVAMALGIPVCASPIPSYGGSPAYICHTSEDWSTSLRQLINDEQKRQECSERGIVYCKERCTPEVIMPLYKKLFQALQSKL